LLEIVFENSEKKIKQLRSAFERPAYNYLGINKKELNSECNELLNGFINEIRLLNDNGLLVSKNDDEFINSERIEEIKRIKSEKFDYIKLIALCNELNSNYQNKNYLSVAILGRAIIDHIPPIFQADNFKVMANNIGSKSLKKNLIHLENSMRNIADNYLHQTIRKKEILPNKTQIEFKSDLDTLLAEIVRINK